ncbi:hypothetical protein [Nocardia thraciensis]
MRRVLPERRRWMSRTAALLLVTGATVAGVGLAAGSAGADTGGRANQSSDRGAAANRDTTGWRHIDPRGYHHKESNPLRQAEIRDNRREYRQQRRTAPDVPQRALGTEPNTSTWTEVPNADGTGWAVCRPQASWC